MTHIPVKGIKTYLLVLYSRKSGIYVHNSYIKYNDAKKDGIELITDYDFIESYAIINMEVWL